MVSWSAVLLRWGPIGHGRFGLLVIFEGSSTGPLEEYTFSNPVALIRQKSKFVQKRQGHTQVRRLSQHQWHTLIETAQSMAAENPGSHERTLFMISALYSMYLGISELAASERRGQITGIELGS